MNWDVIITAIIAAAPGIITAIAAWRNHEKKIDQIKTDLVDLKNGQVQEDER